MKRQLLIALFAYAAATAGAQTIYRCGSTYSETPCSEGTTVQALSAPSAADAAAARKETEREMKVANEMEKARLKEEAKPVAAYIPKEKVEAIAEHKPEVFVARVPGAKKKPAAKKKAA